MSIMNMSLTINNNIYNESVNETAMQNVRSVHKKYACKIDVC